MGQMIKKPCSDTNIITLPESDDSTLCVTYTNIVDVEEYETCVCDPIAAGGRQRQLPAAGVLALTAD